MERSPYFRIQVVAAYAIIAAASACLWGNAQTDVYLCVSGVDPQMGRDLVEELD